MTKKHTNQIIICQKEDIQYNAVFSARRTFAIEIHPNLQVIVRVPKRMSLATVDKQVEERLEWIRKKLDYFRKHPMHIPVRRYVDGEAHLYLGKHYPLKISVGNANSIQLLQGHFDLHCEAPITVQKIKALLDNWYLGHSKVIFDRLLQESFPYFADLGFSLPRLRIRYMKTRWGSLSPDNVVTLNSDLVRAPMECVEYVVFHELCHLKHRGHGKRFYDLMGKVLPDWRERRELLKQIIP
jgi:predicted metal-dependent hydrolase